jgi:hypothetical protein
MSRESFTLISRKLIDNEEYYDKAIAHFDKSLTTWGIKYQEKTGIKDYQMINDENLLLEAYRARIRAMCPDGKVKKYADVYEELE